MKDYTKLTEITVTSQHELDDIPLDFKGRIYIKFGDKIKPAIVKNKYYCCVEALENSSVVALENSSVEAWGNSSVEAWGNSSVVARENSSVVARENSSVEAWGNSSVEAWGNSSVESWRNSSVVARENSSVEAWGNSSVEAWGNSSVVARENSSVEAWGKSSVEARENSSVEAWGNSSVVACGNVQVVDRLADGKIKISGNARITYMPKNIYEFMDFYGIKHNKKTAFFYKAVRKINNELCSDYDNDFKYVVGETVCENKLNTNVEDGCGTGIHISHLNWALNFGNSWNNLSIIEVEVNIDDIILPENSNGKVRTNKVKVLREVPLSECGLYGKMIERRLQNA
jgi:hypothetical protein